jgi:bifunctional ADP-heptose synthase (sugar kinase/adenylyltransferase)
MRILCIGDFIQDIFFWGEAKRLCPEAPVPVIVPANGEKYFIEDIRSGGGGLVQAQLRELGADCLGRYGSLSTKRRYFACDRLICRLDEDSELTDWDGVALEPSLEWADVFVVSDYGKGAMTFELARKIVDTGKPCYVDAKNHWAWFEGKNVTIFPNHHEATPVASDININSQYYVRECIFGRVVSKMGKDGCRLNDDVLRDLVIPANVTSIVDQCGAGDIFMAGFVWARSLQFPIVDCLQVANILAGESCLHLGTFVVPRQFAESVLDKLRSSRGSQPPAPDYSPDSNLSELQQRLQPVQTSSPSIEGTAGIPRANCGMAQAILGEVEGILQRAQIPHRSPLSPTESTGTPIPSGQGNSDESDKKWPLG